MASDELGETPPVVGADRLGTQESKHEPGEATAVAWMEKPWVRKAWKATRTVLPFVLVAGLMVGGSLLRLHYFKLHTEYTTDSYYYMILARSLRSGLGYSVRGTTHTMYLPAYPLLIMLFSYVIKDMAHAAVYIAILGAAFTILFTYLLGKELIGKVAGVLGAAILTFQPAFLKWTCLPMTEGFFTLCFTGGVYFWLTGCSRGSKTRRMVGAASGGIALITKWEGVLIFPLMAVILVLYFKEAELSLWELPVELGLFSFPIMIFLIRNLVVSGRVTNYIKVYSEQKAPITVGILGTRLKVYTWYSLYDKVVMVLFYVGAAIALFLRKKAFLIFFSWFFLFAAFHLFWYWTYERYMVPAIPAMALLAGFVFQQVLEFSHSAFRLYPKKRESLDKKVGKLPTVAARSGMVCLFCAVLLLLAGAFAFTIDREVRRGQVLVREHYKALADDSGGKALNKVAEWLKANVKDGQKVASDFGPDLNYAYSGPLFYVLQVPFGAQLEDVDFRSPGLLGKLSAAGVKYLVLGHVPPPHKVDLVVPAEIPAYLAVEMADLGLTQGEADRLKLVALFTEQYDFPVSLTSDTAVFEVPPR